ncbi:MAG: carbamoyltransferase HypF [Acidobacteria bacterium]|nr:carbamoyltransferase HypF [Acidobacteriota bacterium]
MTARRQIEVAGIVQGVGFRPFVFRLAESRNLSGHIRNTASGVTIEVQGEPSAVNDFLLHLGQEAPPLSRITNITTRELPVVPETEFSILHSQGGEGVHTLISPDVALCADCLREMLEPADRRYRYPFINCTNCGPRFTIVRSIPYDRAQTSMAVFPMCPECQAEYDDPHNRRFHAQPNACWRCGPRLELRDQAGTRIECADPMAGALEKLQAGQVVAIKGLGGFHLAVDALNPVAVRLLRERKRRVEKPFAIMVPNTAAAEEFCVIDDAARRVLESVQRPIVLLPRLSSSPVAEDVAPGHRELGIFLPYTPLHHLLFAQGKFSALVMTSGNRSEEPIAIANQEAVARLRGLADFFLVHNREILLRCDDSLVRASARGVRQVRRSRGYVPLPVFLKEEQPAILAVGGELKNTICLMQGKQAFLSQHLGDLENPEAYKFFLEAIQHLQNILEITPEVVAHDLHPAYFSTHWARQQTAVRLVGVQHHHAHIASCMAENHLEGKVIGLALDGTGYGTDGKIWGGEVLVADYAGFERAAHLEYVPMPGGEAAIRDPWRMAIGYLAHHFGEEVHQLPLPWLRKISRRKIDTLVRMTRQHINSPWTSSCGRLFDAVAALTGIRQTVTYEAQAAVELEAAMGDATDHRAYPFALDPSDGGWVIGTRPLWETLLRDLDKGVPQSVISLRFHQGLMDVLAETVQLVRGRTGFDRVCLSGGTFLNKFLSTKLTSRLASAGFAVYTQNEVPAGDGGLSLGQAMVAAAQVRGEALLLPDGNAHALA